MGILNKLNKEGHTIVMVTHHPDHWRQATRVVQSLDGKITGDRLITAAEQAGGERAQEAQQPMQPGPYPIAPAMPVEPRQLGSSMMSQVGAKCSTENRPIAKYCRACGFKLSLTPSQTQEVRMRLAGVDMTCQSCGQLNRPIAKFCGRCGTMSIHRSPPSRRDTRRSPILTGNLVTANRGAWRDYRGRPTRPIWL